MFRVETGLAPSPHAASTETRQAASLQEIRGALICAGSHLVSAEDILSQPQPPPDVRVAYGADPNQFLEVRLPRTKGPHSVLLNVHGGYWRPKYDLAHAGHLCEALRGAGIATFNIEYRRVGNAGGGWPGTFEDIRSAYRFVRQDHSRFHLDLDRLVVMGHSAGGQLALCLAAHETSLRRAISLAGVVN